MVQRREEIVETVNRLGEVSISQLKELFPDVSEVTLRKDLKYLNSTMQIVRIHGGAKSLPAAIGTVDSFFTRSAQNIGQKNIIAKKAANLLSENQSLFIAAGSTCTQFVKSLPDIPLHVFTDGLVTAIELSKFANVDANLIGGSIDSDVRCCGPKMFEDLSRLHLDYSFIGTDGYRPGYGFVCCSANSASLFSIARSTSDNLVVLMDSTKVNATRAPRIIPPSEIDIVVTDGLLDESVIKSFTKAGVTVL